MLADFDDGTRARRIDGIAFGSQEVNAAMRKFLVRERVKDHFKTALDIVMVLERMQNGNMRRERRISLKLVERLAKRRSHVMQILFRRLILRHRIFKRKAKPAEFQGAIAYDTRFFDFQNCRIDHGADFLDFVLDDRILVIDIHQIAIRQVLHNLHWRKHNESKNRTDC